ncbi:NADH dehydrogenase [ubiquinone] flavoprotein 3, mitochondrial-like [Micropterus dolomieu]|uniref:NADH dehydrogenase [ubiquinone] flavoprotein 3, mitochondrial-like n=1 Tax=Micropterus dolomieu TaxID=147949 RepID=UPI001E8D282D|nr:NADH dehydrogenase [ubiquinone] flavoprotein 3, mitochondrial-like [Micropterus dolomieu]
MATSLLRLGRLGSLKCLQVDSWGVLKTRTAASFCTQAEEPAKPVKKTKPASRKSAAAAPPEPEEHFDNSTYKNYQHHNYNPYTFADLDVEMAKFRLPQPSSIRH